MRIICKCCNEVYFSENLFNDHFKYAHGIISIMNPPPAQIYLIHLKGERKLIPEPRSLNPTYYLRLHVYEMDDFGRMNPIQAPVSENIFFTKEEILYPVLSDLFEISSFNIDYGAIFSSKHVNFVRDPEKKPFVAMFFRLHGYPTVKPESYWPIWRRIDGECFPFLSRINLSAEAFLPNYIYYEERQAKKIKHQPVYESSFGLKKVSNFMRRFGMAMIKKKEKSNESRDDKEPDELSANQLLVSAIQLIDLLSENAEINSQPTKVQKLIELFRRDDVRLFFNSCAFQPPEASTSTAPGEVDEEFDSNGDGLNESHNETSRRRGGSQKSSKSLFSTSEHVSLVPITPTRRSVRLSDKVARTFVEEKISMGRPRMRTASTASNRDEGPSEDVPQDSEVGSESKYGEKSGFRIPRRSLAVTDATRKELKARSNARGNEENPKTDSKVVKGSEEGPKSTAGSDTVKYSEDVPEEKPGEAMAPEEAEEESLNNEMAPEDVPAPEEESMAPAAPDTVPELCQEGLDDTTEYEEPPIQEDIPQDDLEAIPPPSPVKLDISSKKADSEDVPRSSEVAEPSIPVKQDIPREKSSKGDSEEGEKKVDPEVTNASEEAPTTPPESNIFKDSMVSVTPDVREVIEKINKKNFQIIAYINSVESVDLVEFVEGSIVSTCNNVVVKHSYTNLIQNSITLKRKRGETIVLNGINYVVENGENSMLTAKRIDTDGGAILLKLQKYILIVNLLNFRTYSHVLRSILTKLTN